ncbi:MAG: HIT family protein [Planctomycetota bacterium]
MERNDDCIFCKIADGEIPATRLLETERVISFLDINPVNQGHALVVPKRHVEDLLGLRQKELHAAIFAVQRVSRAVVRVTEADGFNVLQNNGEVSGQEIPHVHFHVIPRFEDDGFDLGWRQGSYADGEIEVLRDRILQHL